jgi:hypothetical protein
MLLNAGSPSVGTRADIPFLRDILPSEYAHDKPALLEKYLTAYFPEFGN